MAARPSQFRVPTVAQLIEEHGCRIATQKCHVCGYFTLYDCGAPGGNGASIVVCGLCDTDRDEMKMLREVTLRG